MIKGGKHPFLGLVRSGWIAIDPWIFVLKEQSSSSPSCRLSTPENQLSLASRKDKTKKRFPLFSIRKAETLPCVCFQFN